MLTFDKIRDLERAERASKKLQKIPEDLVAQIREYIKRKERVTEKTSEDLREMENIMATIKRLFEMRESKILSSVSDTLRTGMPPDGMTKDEEAAFYKLTETLRQYREKYFHDISTEPGPREIVYRVAKSVPSFIGPDMKTYELKENEMVQVPKPLDELLLKEGIIERVE